MSTQITIRNRRTGEERRARGVPSGVRSMFGRTAQVEGGTKIASRITMYTVTGPYNRKVDARQVLGEVVVYESETQR